VEVTFTPHIGTGAGGWGKRSRGWPRTRWSRHELEDIMKTGKSWQEIGAKD